MVQHSRLGLIVFAAVTMIFVLKRASHLNDREDTEISARRQRSNFKPLNKKDIRHNRDRSRLERDIEVKLPEQRVQGSEVKVQYDKSEVHRNMGTNAEKIAKSDNLDHLWFKWLEHSKMPDNGRVYESVRERLETRKSWMQASCQYMNKLGYRPPNFKTFQYQYRKHYMVNHEHKMLYCYLPKVANTNFRRVFLGLEGVVPKAKVPDISGYDVYFVHDDKYSYLKDFSVKQQHYFLQSYTKFMVVRDPLERLLSGYRNKYFHPNKQQTTQFLNKITKFYQKHSYLTRRKGIYIRMDYSNAPLAFEEFLLFFTDTYDAKAFLNEHFTASNQLCDPCYTNVDYVAKFDTLYEDVAYIFKKLKIDIEFPGKNDYYHSKDTVETMFKFYERIPKWLLIKVWNILKYDYVLFGFQVPRWFKNLVTKVPDDSLYQKHQ
ncbi:hypothetical protein ACF0H5_019997 [Mactra antiquata]